MRIIPLSFVLSCLAAVVPAQAPDADKPAVREDAVVLRTASGSIFGSLVIPVSKKKVPVVVIIAGSGPTDRNGNSPLLPGSNNAYKLLAEELAKNGIASLRFDKRAIGESAAAMKSESDLRFDDYINDVVGLVNLVRLDQRISTVTIAGHSEGSLIGMVAAKKARVEGFVSLAGAGRSIDTTILTQLKPQLKPETYQFAEKALTDLRTGKTVENVPAELMSILRPSVQPYMASWIKYDPAVEIGKLTMPTLIVQGTTDAQISVDDAKLLSKSAPKAKLLIVEGVAHPLKKAERDQASQMKAYSDPSLPVEPSIVAAIVELVQKLPAK